MGAETSRLVPVMNGSACAGFLIDLGARGTEAFDKDEKSLGVFPDVISAATAVKQSAAPDAAGGMRVLGVDPGISGGLAIVEITDGAARSRQAASAKAWRSSVTSQDLLQCFRNLA
jgi:hypothetical protein